MIVCVCNALNEQELRETARDGARTPEKAFAELGCEPQCGSCLRYVHEIIDEEWQKRPRLQVVA